MDSFDELLQGDAFRDDPYPVYARLRADCPVYWSERWGCWVLTRHADVVSVIQDFRRFSNRDRVTNVIKQRHSASFLKEIRPLLEHFQQGLINTDPPDHTRLRRLIQKAFAPAALEALKPGIRELVTGLCSRYAGAGRMDLVRDLAFPLPIQVVAELLGVPAAMGEQLKSWSVSILEFQAVPNAEPETILRSQSALLEMRGYFRDLVESRRRLPRGDLVSELVRAEEGGDQLSTEELLSTGVSLLVAGHETTTNLIASAAYLLLRHPDQLAQIRRDCSLLPGAVEEALRYESPLQRLGRTVLEDVNLDGRPVRRGQTVLSMLGAANRDPAVFVAPERFDIQRRSSRHLAFGQGIHFCLGAALARIEAPLALEALLLRFPNLRLERSKLAWNSGVMRGLKELPIRFDDPGAPAGH